jgi:hypothetical protein
MNFLCLTIVSTVSTAAFAVENPPPAWTPRIVSYFHSSGGTLKGPDRTITWGAWKKVPGAEFGVRTGDRYFGEQSGNIIWDLSSTERRPKQSNCS